MNIATYEGGMIQTKAYRVLRAHAYACLEAHQLNPTAWSMIGLVATTPEGVRASDIAATLGVKAPLITQVGDELIRRNFIERVTDTADQRAKLLHITPTGLTAMHQIEGEMTKALSTLLRGISAKELATYHKVLRTIIANDDTSK